MSSQFRHLPDDRHATAGARQASQGPQGCDHGVRVRIVAVIEDQHALVILELQPGFQRRTFLQPPTDFLRAQA